MKAIRLQESFLISARFESYFVDMVFCRCHSNFLIKVSLLTQDQGIRHTDLWCKRGFEDKGGLRGESAKPTI